MHVPVSIRFACLAFALAVVMGGSGAQAQLLRPPTAEVTSLLAADGVRQGTGVRAAIRVRLPEGLHTNANKPRDPSLIPIVLSIDAPAGVSVEEIVYPEPTDLAQEGVEELLAVYEEEFVIGVQLNVAGDVGPGEIAVPASLRYQACDERVCYIPATVSTGWTLEVVSAGETVAVRDPDVFAAIPFGTGEAPPAPVAVEAVPAVAATSADPLALIDQFTLAGSTGGYLGGEDFLGFIRDAESGVQQQGWFEGRGLFAILFIVLIGGLALNLTPCVLPMIPINLAIIGAGAQAGSRRRGFLLGSAYGAAMALVYGVLGLVVILTAGTFGTINASPWFNVAIAGVFVVLGMAMFDVITIDFSRWSTRFNVSSESRGTFLVAFGMGSVAALLAGACVAPGRHSGGAVLEQSVHRGHDGGAGTALPPRDRNGSAVACGGRGHQRDAEAGRMDGAREARVRGADSRHVPVLRVPRLHVVCGSLGRCLRSGGERGREAEGRLAFVSGRGARGGAARAEAGAGRSLGDVVQELPDHGQDDACRSRRRRRARRLRADQVPGGGSSGTDRRGSHAALRRDRVADVRHPRAECGAPAELTRERPLADHPPRVSSWVYWSPFSRPVVLTELIR